MKRLAVLAATLLVSACATDDIVALKVPALRETQPMSGAGDRADDPALWVNTADPAKSLILGTNKDEGVWVYDLDGRELQTLLVGRVNNIDLRDNLAVASNDQVNGLTWLAIDPATLKVTHVGDSPTNKVEPYGVCAGKVDGAYTAVATYKDGTIQVWVLGREAGAAPTMRASVKLGSQLEGCVIDDATGRMFVGEENVGLWVIDLLSEDMAPKSIDKVNSGSGLVADVEGVSLWAGDDGSGYVVASAQAKDRYVLYDRNPPHAVKGVISVGDSLDGKVDGTSHTDGLLASSAPLPGLPRGVLIVQDDANPVSEVDQNFKIVDWREVEKALATAAVAPR